MEQDDVYIVINEFDGSVGFSISPGYVSLLLDKYKDDKLEDLKSNIEKEVDVILEKYIMENNTPEVREEIKNEILNYLNEILK